MKDCRGDIRSLSQRVGSGNGKPDVPDAKADGPRTTYPQRTNPRSGKLEELRPSTGGKGSRRWQTVEQGPIPKLGDPLRRHHAWAKYLGGAEKQDLVQLPKSLHDAYHSGLDKILPRQRGIKYYEGLCNAAREQMYRDLAAYTKAFDAKYGTKIYEAMLKEGFPHL